MDGMTAVLGSFITDGYFIGTYETEKRNIVADKGEFPEILKLSIPSLTCHFRLKITKTIIRVNSRISKTIIYSL